MKGYVKEVKEGAMYLEGHGSRRALTVEVEVHGPGWTLNVTDVTPHLGLVPGYEVEIIETNGRLELKPV